MDTKGTHSRETLGMMGHNSMMRHNGGWADEPHMGHGAGGWGGGMSYDPAMSAPEPNGINVPWLP